VLPVVALTLMPVRRDRPNSVRPCGAWPTPGAVELMANVVLFVAPVLLAGVATRHPVAVLIVASALSTIIEARQALVVAWVAPAAPSTGEANTLGASLAGVATGLLT
jgi:hypothetical protein